MLKIEVFSHSLFEEWCKKDNLDDGNVDNEKDKAFIDIIGTEECLKYYLDEPNTKHYFEDHPNVLNLEFDDTPTDVMYKGHLFKTMNMTQAERTVNFIEEMIEDGVTYFRICCRAGMSRSRAIAEFIYRHCLQHEIEVEYADRTEYTTMLNRMVLLKLQHAYYKKHQMYEYSNGYDYPDDIKGNKIEYV